MQQKTILRDKQLTYSIVKKNSIYINIYILIIYLHVSNTHTFN